jgi:hypothetical protein
MQLAAARGLHERRGVELTAKALDAQVDRLLEKRRWMLARAASTNQAFGPHRL